MLANGGIKFERKSRFFVSCAIKVEALPAKVGVVEDRKKAELQEGRTFDILSMQPVRIAIVRLDSRPWS